MADTKSADDLRAEIAEIDRELAQTAETQAKAQSIMGELALPARRGNTKAAKKLAEYERALAEEQTLQRRRQAARAALESELQTALALERTEETKAKAREAQEIIEIFRKRGAVIDAAFRTAIDEYFALLADAGALERLGARINSDLIAANGRRAVRAALARLRIEGVALVPPLDRHSFSELVSKWANGAKQWACTVLGEEPPATPATPAQNGGGEMPPPVESGKGAKVSRLSAGPPAAARSWEVAPHRNIHVTDASDPAGFEIKPLQQRMN